MVPLCYGDEHVGYRHRDFFWHCCFWQLWAHGSGIQVVVNKMNQNHTLSEKQSLFLSSI